LTLASCKISLVISDPFTTVHQLLASLLNRQNSQKIGDRLEFIGGQKGKSDICLSNGDIASAERRDLMAIFASRPFSQ
jgi:hypothetical protein